MPWPVPTPAEIAASAAAALETRLGIDVRRPNSVGGVLARIIGMALWDAHIHQRWWGDQVMPDTAGHEHLRRHAAIWGVQPRLSAPAIGRVVLAGAAGLAIPAGLALRAASGPLYRTTAPAVLGAGGRTAVPVRAEADGADGNRPAGTTLSLVSPLAGLAPQSAVVDAQGLAGGADAEGDDSLRDRLVAHIRERPHGGAVHDYAAWARAVPGVDKVAVRPHWVGLGSVGIVVAMAGPRSPNAEELAAVQAAIEAERPVTVTQAVLLPAALRPVDIEIRVSPDTAAVRAAVETAIAVWFALEAGIGGALHRSRLSEAISAAAGEYAHWLTAPAADVAVAADQLPVPGRIVWKDAPP